jgi:hypothetical protein
MELTFIVWGFKILGFCRPIGSLGANSFSIEELQCLANWVVCFHSNATHGQ